MTIIKIDDEIGYWGISARDIKDKLAESTGNITVEINSPGGSVIEGIAIYNALKEYNKGTVTTVNIGLAASMASYIALAGDVKKAYDNAIYMIHNASGFAWGDYREMTSRAKVLQSMSNILKKAYVSQTGKTDTEMQEAMDNETFYFGQEIIDSGFVDEIISTDTELDESSAKTLAKESFTACVGNISKNTKAEEYEQIDAIVKENLRVNSASAKIANQTQGDNVEYTKESFEALTNTHAEALTTAKTDAVATERKRVSQILALHGDDKTKSDAIEKGLSAGDCAIELNKAVTVAATNFEQAAADVADVATSVATEEKTEEETKTDEALAALAKLDEGKK